MDWSDVASLCAYAEDPENLDLHGRTGVNPFNVDALQYEEIELILCIRMMAKMAEIFKTIPEVNALLTERGLDRCIFSAFSVEVVVLNVVAEKTGAKIPNLPPLSLAFDEQDEQDEPDSPGRSNMDIGSLCTHNSTVLGASTGVPPLAEILPYAGYTGAAARLLSLLVPSNNGDAVPILDAGLDLPQIDHFFGHKVAGLALSDFRLKYLGPVEGSGADGDRTTIERICSWDTWVYTFQAWMGLNVQKITPANFAVAAAKILSLFSTALPVIWMNNAIHVGKLIGGIMTLFATPKFAMPVELIKQGAATKEGRQAMQEFYKQLGEKTRALYAKATNIAPDEYVAQIPTPETAPGGLKEAGYEAARRLYNTLTPAVNTGFTFGRGSQKQRRVYRVRLHRKCWRRRGGPRKTKP